MIQRLIHVEASTVLKYIWERRPNMTLSKLKWPINYSRIFFNYTAGELCKFQQIRHFTWLKNSLSFLFCVMTSGDCSAACYCSLIKTKFISPRANDFATIVSTPSTYMVISSMLYLLSWLPPSGPAATAMHMLNHYRVFRKKRYLIHDFNKIELYILHWFRTMFFKIEIDKLGTRSKSLLKSWGTTFLPNRYPPLIFAWFTSKSHEL